TAGNRGLFWALLIFVGIPLPGTGAWTGTLAASFLKIDFKTSVTAIMLGVILARIIMSLGSKVVSILGWPGLIAIIAVIVVAIIVSIILNKKKSKK
ncbi:small multi-drug export protein, partial [uncultured Duncaniella sp.]|uniref:small multi-drug export protein n=1 Tax=uncultured Duncaniella sp. TaxID=2768039 RepID=UPI0025B08725